MGLFGHGLCGSDGDSAEKHGTPFRMWLPLAARLLELISRVVAPMFNLTLDATELEAGYRYLQLEDTSS